MEVYGAPTQCGSPEAELFARWLRKGDERVPLSTEDCRRSGARSGTGSICSTWTTDSTWTPVTFSSATFIDHRQRLGSPPIHLAWLLQWRSIL